MRILYLDCPSGISGDMFVGAMLDAGLSISFLESELSKLKLKGYAIRKKTVFRNSIRCTKFDVLLNDEGKGLHSLKRILTIIDKSRLDKGVKELSKNIFLNIAKVESKIHKTKLDDIHFHEIGNLDSVIDIVSAAIAVKKFGIDKAYGSTLNLSKATPATLALLKGYKIKFLNLSYEIVTPTGAAIFCTLVKKTEPPPTIDIVGVGHGAGDYQIDEMANILNVIIGKTSNLSYNKDKIIVVETNIDDTKPIMYEYIIEKLLNAGASDVFITPVYMKKTRPGVLLTVLVKNSLLKKIANIIFEETTTIGLRYYEADRIILERKTKKIKTKYGTVNFKISKINSDTYRISPEYEDCKRLAKRLKLPLQKIYQGIQNG